MDTYRGAPALLTDMYELTMVDAALAAEKPMAHPWQADKPPLRSLAAVCPTTAAMGLLLAPDDC